MSSNNNIRRHLDAVAARFGLKFAAAASLPRYVSYVGRVKHDVCVFLRVHDARTKGGSFITQIWVAPLHFPDDGVDRLGIAYRLDVYESFVPGPMPLDAIAARCALLLPQGPYLADAILEEMKDMRLAGPRLSVSLLERNLYAEVIKVMDNTDVMKQIRKTAMEVCVETAPYDALITECSRLGVVLLDHRERWPILRNPFFESGCDSQLIGMMLGWSFYLDALIPWPSES